MSRSSRNTTETCLLSVLLVSSALVPPIQMRKTLKSEAHTPPVFGGRQRKFSCTGEAANSIPQALDLIGKAKHNPCTMKATRMTSQCLCARFTDTYSQMLCKMGHKTQAPGPSQGHQSASHMKLSSSSRPPELLLAECH